MVRLRNLKTTGWQADRYPQGVNRPKMLAGLVVFFLLTTSVAGFWIIDLRFRPTLARWAKARATQIATVAINFAVSETIAQSIKAEDLVFWKQDMQGNLVAAQYDMGEINRIVAQTTLRVQDALKTMGDERIPIPLGQVLGSEILAAMGPTIPVRIVPVGTVETFPYASFTTGGINQVWHKIYLKITAKIRIVVPMVTEDTLVETQIPITEEILLGKVPEVYLSMAGKGEEASEIVIPLGAGAAGAKIMNQ